jgi:Bacterial Ig domain
MSKKNRSTQQRASRVENFPVRRWLHVGAASAGMGAALLGWSLAGPSTGVAAADSTDTSSASSTSSSASAGPAHHSSQAKSSKATKTVAPRSAGGRSTSTLSSRAVEAEKPTAALNVIRSTVSTAASTAPTAKPALRPSRTTGTATSSTAAATAVPSTVDPHREAVAKEIANFMAAAQGTIASLPVDAGVKDFLNGGLVLVRRTFLNQAPVVNPVQVTGKIDGPITGTVGAVDLEGDHIVYKVVQGPTTGVVSINPDGTYTYTPGVGFNGVDTFSVSAVDTGLHLNLLDLFRPLGSTANNIVNQGAITFEFNYVKGGDLWDADARAALQRSASALVEYFTVTKPVVLSYDVTGIEDTGKEATLASAGSEATSAAAGFYPTVVQNEIQTGVDANGTAADGQIEWNFANGWDYNADGAAIKPDEYDFEAVAIHELLHSFGFLSNVRKAGDNAGTNWYTFDRFVVTSDGTKAINGNSWNTALDPNLTGANGGLSFGGKAAVDAYGKPVPLFTPPTFDDTGSVSHVDDKTFTKPNEKLMNSATGTGPSVRVLSPIEIGILTDLGYIVHAQAQSPSQLPALVGFPTAS